VDHADCRYSALSYSIVMDKLTHLNALRAAARVAFGVAVLGGCTAAATEEDATPGESDIKSSCGSPSDAGAKADANADAKTDAQADARADAKVSCQALLAASFPDGGDGYLDYVNKKIKPGSDDVKACCEEALAPANMLNTETGQYRWSCCGALGANGPGTSPEIAMACTPWGPPVPPKMRAVA
jgi:hypothetical protein